MGVETWVAIGKFLLAVVGYGSAGTGYYWIGVQVARVAILAYASKAFAPKADLTQTAREKLITVRDPIYPQAFVYGQDMLSGPLFIANTTGTTNKNLTMGIALVGHEIDSVISYRLDDEDVPLTDISGGGGSPSGVISNGKFDGVAEVSFQLGTATQTEDALLNSAFGGPGLWTTAHRLRGWAYMVWQFILEEDNTAYETGAPQNIKVIIKGKKVYDPRLDSTNGGAGSHRLADPTTWAWSENPALCLADFLIDTKFGCSEDSARIDWPMIITAADVCEETVSLPSAGSQSRYTCNVTFRADEARGDIKDALLQSMMGRIVFSQGLWKIWAGEALTSDVELTEANLAGEIVTQASTGSKERYNRVRGKYIDPSRDYSANTYPEQRSTAYETEDGGEVRPAVIDFLATNNSFEAQRKAIIVLKQSRQQRVVSFQGNFSCFRIQPGAVVTLTIDEYGFAGEKFFVTEWAMGENGITLTLVEEIDSAWADPATGEYTTRTPSGVLTFVNQGQAAPTGLAANPVLNGVRLTWTNPPAADFSSIEIWASNDNVRGNAEVIATTQGNSYIDNVAGINRLRYYWIRAISIHGTPSAYEPNLTTTTAIAYPYIQEEPLVADPFIRLGAAFWDVSNSNASYQTLGGLNGTDAIRLSTDASFGGSLYAAARRGPDEWDVQSFNGMTIQLRWRSKLVSQPGGTWTAGVSPRIKVTAENETGASLYLASSSDAHLYSQASTAGIWHDDTAIVRLTDTGVSPRYIQIGLFVGKNFYGPEWDIEFLSASFQPNVFKAEGDVGLVPSSAGASTKYLKGDGTWDDPPGGGGGAVELSDLTDVNTSTPTNRFVLVADGVDFESRVLLEADISDLGTYEPVDGTIVRTGDAAWNATDWDTAFGWGNHAGLYSLLAHIHSTFDRGSSVLSGANVFSNIVVTDGIVTAISTRALTASDIGAATTLPDLTDVDLTGLVTGALLFKSAGGDWIDTAGMTYLSTGWLELAFQGLRIGDTSLIEGIDISYDSVNNRVDYGILKGNANNMDHWFDGGPAGLTELALRRGLGLQLWDNANADNFIMRMGAANLDMVFSGGTADWNITGLTGRVKQGAETLAYVSEIGAAGAPARLTDNANITTAGWYRIAKNALAGGRGAATFYVSSGGGGSAPTPIMFRISKSYQANLSDATITVMSHVNGGTDVQQIRIILDTTLSEIYVEVYIGTGTLANWTHEISPDDLGTWTSVDYTAGATADDSLTWDINANNVMQGWKSSTQHSYTTKLGALVISGTVDGRDVAADGSTQDAFIASTTGQSLSGNRWGVNVRTETNGVVEMGKYIDFHDSDGDLTDYSVRLTSAVGALNLAGTFEATNVQLFTDSPFRAQEMANTQDLDDLAAVDAGFYYQTSNADTTGNNYPVDQAGSLLTQRAAGVGTQMYITYNSSTAALYWRANYQTGFGTWRKAATSNIAEIITAAWTWDIGAGGTALNFDSTSSWGSGTLNMPGIRWKEADGTITAAIRAHVNPSDVKVLMLGTEGYIEKLRLQSDNNHHMTGNLGISGTVDGRDVAADGAVLDGITSNATHTGQITGSTVLTLDKTAISDQAAAGALIGTDSFLVLDGGNLREITASQMFTYMTGGTPGNTESKFKIAPTARFVTSMADDPDISGITLLKKSMYRITGFLVFDAGSTAPDLDVNFGFSQIYRSCEIHWAQEGTITASKFGVGILTHRFALGTTRSGIVLHGFVDTHETNDGNMALRWAQGNSSGADTTCHIGSWVAAERLGAS